MRVLLQRRASAGASMCCGHGTGIRWASFGPLRTSSADPRKRSRAKVLVVLLLLLGTIGSGAGAARCRRLLELAEGQSARLDFGDGSGFVNFTGGDLCEWHVTSPTQVRLNCRYFYVPYSRDCVYAQLAVYGVAGEGDGGRAHCGYVPEGFQELSSGHALLARLVTSTRSPGGILDCSVTAESYDTSAAFFRSCDCGWQRLNSPWLPRIQHPVLRIVSGGPASVGQFPMMAALYSVLARSLLCGATIVSKRHVLTAAHCFNNRVGIRSIAVIVGAYQNPATTSGSGDPEMQLIALRTYHVHEGYSEKTGEHDIAIVELASPIRYSAFVGPACLPIFADQFSFAGQTVTILGYGTVFESGPMSSVLKRAEVQVLDPQQCREYLPSADLKKICTFRAQTDACQYDTGGPVLWQNPESGRYVVVGVIASGQGCASPQPSLNTRVTAYLEWISRWTGDGESVCRRE